MYGETEGWRYPFFVLGVPSLMIAVATKVVIDDPARGGKEPALSNMIKEGGSYDVRLDWNTFVNTMRNATTYLLILQSFVGSIPWGFIFVFLNDFLTQEKGMGNGDATAIIGIFGVGAGVGAVAGGWAGQECYKIDRSYLPIMMGVTQALGTIPCMVLINTSATSATFFILVCSFATGCLANIAGINVRPALINVNLPEARPAALSVANLVVNLARGLSPVLVTVIQVAGGSRLMAFNLVIPVTWIITSILLLMVVKSYVDDEDKVQYNLGLFVLNRQDENNGSGAEESLRRPSSPEIVLRKMTAPDMPEKGVGTLVKEGLADFVNVFSNGGNDNNNNNNNNDNENEDTKLLGP